MRVIFVDRENQLLKKYYNLDEKNKTATIKLKYDKVSDILDNSLDSNEYKISDGTVENIITHTKHIPKKYRIRLDLKFNDFENCNKYKLLESFNDVLEINNYQRQRLTKIKYIKVGFLILTGIMLLFFLTYAKISKLFGDNPRDSITSEVIDIVAWVFIWEAVTVMFLSPLDLPFNSKMFVLMVNEIRLIDSDDNVFYNENLKEVASAWDSTSKIKSLVDNINLFCGVAFIGIGISSLIRYINTQYLMSMINISISTFVVDIIVDLIQILIGIGITTRYLGYTKKWMRKLIVIFNVFVAIDLILTVIIIASGDVNFNDTVGVTIGDYIKEQLIYLVTLVLYIISSLLECVYSKHQKKLDENAKELQKKMNDVIENISKKD